MTRFTGTAGADSILPTLVSPGVTPTGVLPDAGNDRLYGLGGNDTLDGGLGNDSVYGGGGNDYVYCLDGTNVADGGSGTDTLDLTVSGNYDINLTTGQTNRIGESFLNFENVTTGTGDDTIVGTAGDNVIDSGAGNDLILFSGGNDTIFTGDGDDHVVMPSGVMEAYGGTGTDTLDFTNRSTRLNLSLANGDTSTVGEFFEGFENVLAGDGNDALFDTVGNNLIDGGGNDDLIVLSFGDDTVFGGTGNDIIAIFEGTFHLDGGDGIDSFYGGSTNLDFVLNMATGEFTFGTALNFEIAVGGSGNDSITGTDNADRIEGGAGNDTVGFSNGDDTVLGNDGDDLIYAPGGYLTVDGGAGTDTLNVTFYDADYTIDLATGLTTFQAESVHGIEVLIMGDGNDTIRGADGSETLVGGVGNDLIDGGLGVDRMVGGLGDDVIIVDRLRDLALGGAGSDVLDLRALKVGVSFNMAFGTIEGQNGIRWSQFESVLGGSGSDTITGTVGADYIEGGNGADHIASGGGDVVYGGNGKDFLQSTGPGTGGAEMLYAGGGGDIVQFSDPASSGVADGGAGHDAAFLRFVGANGVDVVWDMATGETNLGLTLTGFEEALTGDGNDNVIGTDVANAIESGLGADVLYGLAGDDALFSLGGDDTLVGGDGNDFFYSGSGSDLMFGGSGNDTFLFTRADAVEGQVDTLSDFDGPGSALGDVIDVSLMDADETLDGDQGFVLGGVGAGHLQVVNQNGNTVVRGNTDADAAFEFVLVIEDGATLASAYTAQDFAL